MGKNLTTPSALLPPLLEKEGSIISINPISKGLPPPWQGGVALCAGVVNQVATSAWLSICNQSATPTHRKPGRTKFFNRGKFFIHVIGQIWQNAELEFVCPVLKLCAQS